MQRNQNTKPLALITAVLGMLFFVIGVGTQPVTAAAQFFGSSFEDVAVATGLQDYTEAGCTNRALTNTASSTQPQPNVTHPNTTDGTGATELGFSSEFTDTRGGGDCLSDGDAIGVIEQGESLGVGDNPFDATHVRIYAIEDSDGLVTVTLQGITCGPGASINASADYYVNSSGYESDDTMRIWIEVDGTPTDLINVPDMDAFFDLGAGIEEQWNTVTVGPVIGDAVVFKFEADVNAATEEVLFDNLEIDCGAPTAVTMQNITSDPLQVAVSPITIALVLILGAATATIIYRRPQK